MEEGMIWTYGWVVFVKEEEQFQIGGSIEIYFGPPLLRCLDCLHASIAYIPSGPPSPLGLHCLRSYFSLWIKYAMIYPLTAWPCIFLVKSCFNCICQCILVLANLQHLIITYNFMICHMLCPLHVKLMYTTKNIIIPNQKLMIYDQDYLLESDVNIIGKSRTIQDNKTMPLYTWPTVSHYSTIQQSSF